MNRFREKFNNNDFESKKLPIFGVNMNFKNVILKHSKPSLLPTFQSNSSSIILEKSNAKIVEFGHQNFLHFHI